MIKWLLRLAVFSSTITIAALVVVYYGFQASLPELEGNIVSNDIVGAVTVERDQNGAPTITAANRTDLAFATGYIHAQERFFQMDLSRRMASGELSSLFGALAVDTDKANRLHRFRNRANVALNHISADERDILNQYVKGVNQGLSSLGSKPFEYWLLNAEPDTWTAEDTFLAIYSMFFTLQSSTGGYEWQNHLLKQSLSSDLYEFLLPDRTEWDAPLQEDADENIA